MRPFSTFFRLNVLLLLLSSASVRAEDAVTIDQLRQLYDGVQTGQVLPADFSKQLIALFERPKDLPANLSESINLKLQNNEIAELVANDLYRTVVTFLTTHSASDAVTYRRVANLVLEEDSEGYRKIIRFLDLVERVEILIEKRDVIKLISLREDELAKDETEAVESRLNPFLLKLSEEELKQERADNALRYLAEVNQHWKQDQFSQALEAILVHIEGSLTKGKEAFQSWPFDNVRVLGMLDTPVIFKSEKLRTLLAKLFSDRVLYLIEQEDLEKATYYFQSILKLRPDPSRLNDALRLQSAHVASTDKSKAFAATRLAELESRGSFSFFDKLGLFWGGYYGRAPIIILLLIVALLFGVAGLVVFVPEWVGLPPRNQPVKGYQRGAKVEDEYSRLLAMLGLGDDASDEEIKSTYRQMVKELHPDSSEGETSEEKEAKAKKFVELKKAYERLIERRRSGFTREI